MIAAFLGGLLLGGDGRHSQPVQVIVEAPAAPDYSDEFARLRKQLTKLEQDVAVLETKSGLLDPPPVLLQREGAAHSVLRARTEGRAAPRAPIKPKWKTVTKPPRKLCRFPVGILKMLFPRRIGCEF